MADLLIGTGIALIAALLGWSDRIRDFREETRKIEDSFLEKYNVRRRDLRTISLSTTTVEKATALTRLLQSPEIRQDAEAASIIDFFEKNVPDPQKRAVQAYRWKYRLVVFSAFSCFLGGLLHKLLPSDLSATLRCLPLPLDPHLGIEALAFLSLLVVLVSILVSNYQEDKYRDLVDDFLSEHT